MFLRQSFYLPGAAKPLDRDRFRPVRCPRIVAAAFLQEDEGKYLLFVERHDRLSVFFVFGLFYFYVWRYEDGFEKRC